MGARKYLVTALAACALAIPALHAAGSSPITGPLDNGADLAQALKFEAKIPTHDNNGAILPLNFDKWPELDPSAKPISMDGPGDSGNYSGEYLAAESWRYAQAKIELQHLGVSALSKGTDGGADVQFWRGQRDEALARATRLVKYYHLLINIAKYWRTQFRPSVGNGVPPLADGWIDLGGGIIPGQAGLLMRICEPATSPKDWHDMRFQFAGRKELFGPFRWEDGRDYYCLQGTSRDSYAGTIFGLSVAFDYLGPENRALQVSTGDDLMAMAHYAAKYLFTQPRPHGQISIPVGGGDDLDGPISPMFLQVPLHQLHLVDTAWHAAHVLGDAAGIREFDALHHEQVVGSVMSGQLLASLLLDASQPHTTYYKFQLHMVSLFNVIRLETDPEVRNELMRALSAMNATLDDDGNGFFQAINYALTGDTTRLREAVDLHHQWIQYYDFHVAVSKTGHTPYVAQTRCSITSAPASAPLWAQPLTCVYRNRVDMHQTLPNGQVVTTPFVANGPTGKRSLDPIPVRVRRLTDFLWQKDPTIITADHKNPWEGPSVDFLVTYWMLRYYSEADQPKRAVLPTWLGPSWS